VFFPETINANLFPRFFALTRCHFSYPKGFKIRASGGEFHKTLVGSMILDKPQPTYTSQHSARPPILLNAEMSPRSFRINCWGSLFRPTTLDNMSEDEIAWAKSQTPSMAFLASQGTKISEVFNNGNSPITPFYKVYQDICPICYEQDSPCDTVVAPCGHVYHEKCYLSMLSNMKSINCTICNQATKFIISYK
jgi:hypothetical protein